MAYHKNLTGLLMASLTNRGQLRKKRFERKKRPEWIAQDMQWPPKGEQADFTYTAKNNAVKAAGIKVIYNKVKCRVL
jgi:hypothetical protein